MASTKKKPKKRTFAEDVQYRYQLHEIITTLTMGKNIVRYGVKHKVHRRGRLMAYKRVFADVMKALKEER